MSRLSHKPGRKSNYAKSIQNSPSHKEGRALCLIRDEFKCRICGSTSNIEFHHISYHIKGKETEKDNLRWAVIVCGCCHQSIHNNIKHKWNPKNTFKETA